MKSEYLKLPEALSFSKDSSVLRKPEKYMKNNVCVNTPTLHKKKKRKIIVYF